MRLKWWIPAIIFVMLLNSGCVGKNEAESMTQYWQSVADVTMTGKIREDMGDFVLDYLVKFEYSDSVGKVKVLEPIEIEGITATYEKGEVKLEYGDMSLAARIEKLSPAAFIPTMFSLWQGGFISECCKDSVKDKECLFAAYLSDEYRYTVWFDDSYAPVQAEVYADGERILYCEFVSCSVK